MFCCNLLIGDLEEIYRRSIGDYRRFIGDYRRFIGDYRRFIGDYRRFVGVRKSLDRSPEIS